MSGIYTALAAVLKGLDLLAWIVSCGPMWMALAKLQQPSVYAQEVSKADVNGKGNAPSPVFRSLNSINNGQLTERPFAEVTTLYELFTRAVKKFAKRRALGTRTLLEIKTTEGQRFPTKVFGETKWRHFDEVGEEAHNFGSGLRELGMEPMHLKENEPFSKVEGNHCILMYEDTCAEWFVAAQGAFSQSLVVATAYATLGVDSVISAVNEASVSTIMCNYSSVKAIIGKKDKMPSLKNIIYTTLNLPPNTQAHPGMDSDIRVLSYEEVVKLGQSKPSKPSPPTPADLAILMYTSGSTGKPKGVMVRHRQIVSLLGALKSRAELTEGATLVGYLPLAHIFEMQMEWFVFGYGGEIGYADPKTLVAGPGKCEPVGALAHFRPTIMGAVPKVWEVIKAGAEAKIKAGGPAKEFLFNEAMKWKAAAMPQGRSTPVFDALVFSKIKATLGGRLTLALSGGGAISASVQEWVRTAIGCPLVQGYGLTETCAGLTVQSPRDWRVGVAGAPIDTVEVLLHSEPEISDSNGEPYLTTDKDHCGLPCAGRGEIWVRGNNITDGYFKMQKETDEAYTKDGWFMTGDIGVITPDGTIKIVDRKKNLVKLKGGEYIALERMNQAFKSSPYVDADAGGVCTYGDGDMDRPVCLVQVNHAKVKELAKELKVSGSIEEICAKPEIEEAVMKSLNEEGKKADPPLTSLEKIVGVLLLTKGWSPDAGTLTASLKIVPKAIQKAHKDELEKLRQKGIR